MRIPSNHCPRTLGRYKTDLHNVSFADYARLCGGAGYRVEAPGDIERAFRDALAVDGPSLVEVVSDPLLT